MDYAVHTMPSYQHLMGSVKPSHMGSQSEGHSANDTSYAGAMAGSKTYASEKDPGGATPSRIGSGGRRHLG